MKEIVTLNEAFSTTSKVIKSSSMISLASINERFFEGGLRHLGYTKKSYDNSPLISIITVVYNGKDFIEETILSVINQSYKNVEYVIIDGGSNDGTIDIIKKYDKFIDYWISEKDCGIYDAMNRGIEASTGDWLNFLNAGDSFVNDSVLERLFYKQEQIADLVYGAATIYNSDGEIITTIQPKKFTKFNLFFWTTRVLCHQSVFIRKECTSKYSLQYRLKGELNWYFDLLKTVKTSFISGFPIVKYSLGGLGDTKYVLNSIETIRVAFKRGFIMGFITIPITVYKLLRRIIS